jgi:ribonucleoside-triphosphate reductase
MILPTLGIKYGICTGERTEPDVDGFFEALDDLLDVTVTSLLDRYEYICSQNIKAGYFMYENEDMADGKKAIEANDVEVSMKHGTLAIGFIGVANTCYAMFGEYHDQSERAFKFAERIVKRIYDYAAEMSEKHNLNFSCYATPAENSCYTICNALRREYGTIEGVTDKEYLTNSIHVPVSEKVSIYEKIDLEAKLAKYCTGGNITYVELESGVMNNPLAIRRIIDYAMNHNVGYLALNFPIDTCKDCGSSVGEFEEVCPVCGSHHIESLRRVTGYLTTDYRKFNKGKIAEVKDRFKHSKITTF